MVYTRPYDGIMSWSDDMRCLYCDGKLPAFRKIANGQFCSATHQRAYWKKQELMAVERLTRTDESLRAAMPEDPALAALRPPVAQTPAAQVEADRKLKQKSARRAANRDSAGSVEPAAIPQEPSSASRKPAAPEKQAAIAPPVKWSKRAPVQNESKQAEPLDESSVVASATATAPTVREVPVAQRVAERVPEPAAAGLLPLPVRFSGAHNDSKTSPSASGNAVAKALQPDSIEVVIPSLRLRPDMAEQDPEAAGLLALPTRMGDPAVADRKVLAAGLIAAYPDAADPRLPKSGLEPVQDEVPPTAPKSFSEFGNFLPDSAQGGNAWHHAADFWHHAPRDLKLALFAIPVLVGMALHPRLPKVHVAAPAANARVHADTHFEQVFTKPLDAVQQNLASRAAVVLLEDFRSGMDDWQMHNEISTPWSFDTNGFVQPGSLALYRPSMHLSDYELQFVGLIDQRALSFVARAQDFENYYVVKINILKPGPLPSLGITRYAVINGKAQHRVDMVVTAVNLPDTLLHVNLTVHDDTYLLSLQGKVADSWTEPALTQGGVGFFSARGEHSRIRWLQLTHQYDMLGRLCAFLVPNNISN
jgi:hypothetical protein